MTVSRGHCICTRLTCIKILVFTSKLRDASQTSHTEKAFLVFDNSLSKLVQVLSSH